MYFYLFFLTSVCYKIQREGHANQDEHPSVAAFINAAFINAAFIYTAFSNAAFSYQCSIYVTIIQVV